MKKYLLGLLFVLSAMAPASYGYSYVAIAYSPSTGLVGQGYGPNLATANLNARGYCNAFDCTTVVWAYNGCAALATGYYGRYGYAINVWRANAEYAALANCQATGTACRVAASICSPY